MKEMFEIVWEFEKVTKKSPSIGMAGFPTPYSTLYERASELINISEDTFNSILNEDITREEKVNKLLN